MSPSQALSRPSFTNHPDRSSDSVGPLLSVRNLSIAFGGVRALDDVSLDVDRHQIVGLIGPNGAGKTTLFNCISRLYPTTAGDIWYRGRSISRAPAHHLSGTGICRTFQNLALFDRLSVYQNIRIGTHARCSSNLLVDLFRTPKARRAEAASRTIVEELIETFELRQVARRPAGDLSFGIRKRVEIARALASAPRLLMLDEPAGGLNHGDVSLLGEQIRRWRDQWQLTILMVEHHMGLVMSIADRIVALNFGRKIAEGTPAEIQRNDAVIAAYLGTRREELRES